ncbi:hypothetical protein SK128_016169 [Halocaridina rubra]|uniref:VWFA domain-containing protein n=1 Tax=Halocaridina rubra TaxID=373956 RepID=A0AAN9A4J0_HALRR
MRARHWESAFTVVWVIIMLGVVTVGGTSRAKLVDNGYEGVVVAISQEIDESLGPPIIKAIKEMIEESSRRLFRATQGRAYFRDVHILIPKSWTNTQVNRTALNENYEESDIRIDHMNNVYKNQPYTHQPGGCGTPGQYIHLTPEYLTDMTQAAWWGPRGKVLLMEWAKLRWGVFDELGYPGDETFPLFYLADDRESTGRSGGGAIRPNYCANKPVEGRLIDKRGRSGCGLNQQGEVDDNCRFLPYRDQLADSSLMSYPFIFSDTVVDFCDGDHSTHPHNSVAPNKQNLFCGGRSVWEVMIEHEDFANDANPPTERYVDPVIELVQHADAHYALVLDYSGSMNDHYRVHKLRKTARRWLLHEVADGSYVAIIRFSKAAKLVHPLKRIIDEESRKALADSLGTTADGGTSIGAGLYVAVRKILAQVTNPVILLITDGEENENPRIEHIMKNVLDSGVRVVTVAFGAEADPKLERVAQLTGGKTFTVNDVDEGLMLEDAFEGALTYQPPPPRFNSSVVVHEKVYKGSQKQTGDIFNIDFSIGRNMKLRLDTNDRLHVTQPPHMIRPDGSLVGGAEFDPNTYSWSIMVPMADEGQWQWMVGLSGSEEDFVRVKVTAQTRDPDIEPITTKAWVSTGAREVSAITERIIIYAEVKQGNNPVVNANVSALVTPPNDFDPPELYYLLDNGQGADTQAGDGVYSRYMTKYYGTGRYSVKAQVTDGGQAVINRGFLTSESKRRKRSPRTHYENGEERPDYCCGSVVPIDLSNALTTGSFNRVAVGGSLKVTETQPQNVSLSGDDLVAPPLDIFPPARVRDLKVWLTEPSQAYLKTHNISLSWTATGDDLDTGIVSGYTIRMSTDVGELMENVFDTAPEESVVPLNVTEGRLLIESGQKIHITSIAEMDLNSGHSYYFALKAVDKAGLNSQVSNIAVIGPVAYIQRLDDPLSSFTFSPTSSVDVYYPTLEEEATYSSSGFASYSPISEVEVPSSSFEELISEADLTPLEIESVSDEELVSEEIILPENETLGISITTTAWVPKADEVTHTVSPEASSPEPADKPLLAIPVWAIVVIVVFLLLIIVIVSVILSKRRYGKYDCVET